MRSLTRSNIVQLPSARPRRWRRRVIVMAVVVVAVGGVVAATWRVSEIRVVGAQRVPVEQIAQAASLGGGERMLLTRLGAVAERVRSIPSIREATVERSLWASVVIHVTERVPLAMLEDRPHLVVDGDGVIFEARVDALPAVSGWRGRAAAGERVDATTATVLAAYQHFPDGLRARTTQIIVSDELTLAIRGGAKVRFGAPEDLVRKAAAADAVLGDAGRRGMSLAYVDVRTPSTPVGREWNVATPEPEPTPPPGVTD